MRSAAIIFALCLIGAAALPQSFIGFVRSTEKMPAAERQAKADSFMKATRAFPFTESDTICHFIYKGPATSVSVAGDFTGWQRRQNDMQNIPGTDLWYCTKYFEADARLDYKIVVDKNNWITDPDNPSTCMSGFGPNSELRMPHYVIAPETIYDPAIPEGKISDTLFSSTMLGNSRTVKIYLPPGYSKGGNRYPVIVFHDGLEYITLANACIVLDNMIATRQIRPVIAVFVPPVNREPEYAENKKDLFVSFITRELMPAIDLKYHTSRDPRDRATIGISNGGNIALYLGVMHPECFGKIAAFSSNVIPEITEKVSGSGTMDLQFYLDMGTYDINRLIPMVDDLARLLKGKGYSVTYYKWHEGHSWGSWKGHLGLALKQFFSY